jgi:AcrR family transcriptional regulator
MSSEDRRDRRRPLSREARIEAREARRASGRAGRAGPDSQAPIWSRPEPGQRRARLTRDEIAAVALRLADAGGLEAVSMRRVAAELGVGTMSLYYYVRTKDELIDLMHDRMMGELLVPEDELSEDWRAALEEIARRSRDAFLAHPWATDAPPTAAGPNGIRHFEQSLSAVAGLAVDFATQFEIILMLDDYVFGFTLRELMVDRENETMWEDAEMMESLVGYFQSEVATGAFPQLERLLGDGTTQALLDRLATLSRDRGRFDRGMARVLDGIELDLARRGVP